jgi:hypothetical protein
MDIRERAYGEVCYGLILCLGLAALSGFANNFASAQSVPLSVSSSITASVDPDKAPSEFNHHMAGWALIGIGFVAVASFLFPNLYPLRYVWPALFLIAGLFLALWSDAEIWPRGNLSWTWLLHHDQEAGQHKIYAFLLIAMGFIEYLRVRGFPHRFWRIWAFPTLAIAGAAFLLVHDHTASSGANSPEARAYLVNPALDLDGNPPAPHASDSMPGMDHSMDHSMMDGNHSDMPMAYSGVDQSQLMGNDSGPIDTPMPGHHHHMTPSMLLVKREHFWFMIVGICVSLLKLIADSEFSRRHFIRYTWPSGMVLLGLLLVFYRE